MKQFLRQPPVLLVCRVALAFSWIYQGAIPKVVCKSPGEVNLIAPVAPAYRIACTLITWMGYGEIVFGLVLLFAGAWAFGFNVAVLLALLGWVAVVDPSMFTLPFNPLTLNVSLIALSLVALYELKRPGPDGPR